MANDKKPPMQRRYNQISVTFHSARSKFEKMMKIYIFDCGFIDLYMTLKEIDNTHEGFRFHLQVNLFDSFFFLAVFLFVNFLNYLFCKNKKMKTIFFCIVLRRTSQVITKYQLEGVLKYKDTDNEYKMDHLKLEHIKGIEIEKIVEIEVKYLSG
ncbi:hypothetical protein RFI_01320 [Reticulomyxa filosa]|uniref:Uncharacterized protein n=1 Tax=Reticulomyxa filosa TaxID=46433 RepID=X6PDJ8_RETFI|nr:hypothetical protein RFI_01320 [Reticulomyxa filosa]|eukprot:ETO35742.1 hypothetical protein RFI_01320 [Reticulomyxa filosa]